MSKLREVTVVGAGLVGSLLAIHLARRGHSVRILERRADRRVGRAGAGRSINLALSTRGLHALREVGLEHAVLRQAVPMRGRMIHQQDGDLSFQPYGAEEADCIFSVSRAALNQTLLTCAEQTGPVHIAFNRRILQRDLEARTLRVQRAEDGQITCEAAPHVIATDGSASVIRQALAKTPGAACSETPLDYGYKELLIPAEAARAVALEPHALHIWPRGSFMLIALPNLDGSFTCTLFLPFTGANSFARLCTPDDIEAFFAQHFADARRLLINLQHEFAHNPIGRMVTVKCSPWSVGDHTLLLGDAAHAIVPFFGQGANCGFEDCTVLAQGLNALDREGTWESLFEGFYQRRKAHTDAIADMAVDNFEEMRDKVGNRRFLLEKAVEKYLQQAFPGQFLSRYAMVTFSTIPYRAAADAGAIADTIVRACCQGVAEAKDVDLSRAAALIGERFRPFLQHNAQGSNPWI